MKLRRMLKTAEELKDFYRRFDARLDKTSSPIGCWLWKGEVFKRSGYGRVAIERDGKRKRFWVHQIAYEKKHGTLPKGKVTDHRCRTKLCCNPKHLEAVTNGENVRRRNASVNGSEPGEKCKRGHIGEYRHDKDGKLYCMGCHRDAAYQRRQRTKQAA